MIQKNKLPSWQCKVCGKVYYDDFKEMGYKCMECGSVYQFGLTVTGSKINKDGTFTDEIIIQKEIK